MESILFSEDLKIKFCNLVKNIATQEIKVKLLFN